MPENSTSMSSSGIGDNGNGPFGLRRRVTSGLPSPLVAVCLVSAAFGLAACGPASTGALPASSGTVSAHAAASKTALPSPSASATQSSATAAPSTQPSTSAAAPSPQPSPATSGFALTPAQLPAFNVEAWTEQKLGPVQNVTGHNIQVNECASIDGPATWQQQVYVSRSGGDSAFLEIYAFGTSAEARSAFAGASSGMNSCQATSRALQVKNHITPDAVTRQTASTADAAAFERTWTGVDGISAYGPQTNHLYFATSGTTVVVLHFDEYGRRPAAYDVGNDPAVLATLMAFLTR